MTLRPLNAVTRPAKRDKILSKFHPGDFNRLTAIGLSPIQFDIPAFVESLICYSRGVSSRCPIGLIGSHVPSLKRLDPASGNYATAIYFHRGERALHDENIVTNGGFCTYRFAIERRVSKRDNCTCKHCRSFTYSGCLKNIVGRWNFLFI